MWVLSLFYCTYKIIEESGNLVLKGLVTAEDTPEIDGGEF